MTNSWMDVARAEMDAQGLDAWLICDFRGTNPFAARFLDLDGGFLSRRIFALIPREGTPTLLLSRLEIGSMRAAGFDLVAYGGRAELEERLRAMKPAGRVAIEVSPGGDVPYVSVVDGGTVSMLEQLGYELASSAELLQAFAAWNDVEMEQHRAAATAVMEVLDEAWEFLREAIATRPEVRETDVQDVVAHGFDRRGMTYGHRAIVGFGPNAGDPHYAPRRGEDRVLTPGDVVLIDLFARMDVPGAPYGDVTWMGVYGEVEADVDAAFRAVVAARQAAVDVLRTAAREGRVARGCDVDVAARKVLVEAGYGEAVVHRTGHSLGSAHTHGEAVHFDDFETHDVRTVRPGIGATVEPGVYTATFGVRSELNLIQRVDGPEITTGEQTEWVRLPLGPWHA